MMNRLTLFISPTQKAMLISKSYDYPQTDVHGRTRVAIGNTFHLDIQELPALISSTFFFQRSIALW